MVSDGHDVGGRPCAGRFRLGTLRRALSDLDPELYDPVTNTWMQLPSADLVMPNYPFMFQLPDGRVLYAGSNEFDTDTRALDVATQTWTLIDPLIVAGGSAGMYWPGLVIKAGTAPDETSPPVPAVDTAYVVDMNQPQPAWQQVGSMAYPRAFHTLTILPDGAVAVTGGLETTDNLAESQAVLPAETGTRLLEPGRPWPVCKRLARTTPPVCCCRTGGYLSPGVAGSAQ